MKRLCLIFFFMMSFPLAGFGQAERYKAMREELIRRQENTRAEIDQINTQINNYEERLKMADQKYDRLFSQYEDLKRLIALQDDKISKLATEQSNIQNEIVVTEQQIKENQNRLDELISNYKETLSYLYKHGRTSQLALLLSSESVNQMLVRVYYLGKFDTYSQGQVQEIRETAQELEESKAQLENAREKNEGVLAEIRSEKEKLAERQRQQESNVELLRQNRDQIQTKLTEVRQQKEDLDETLNSLIMEEEKVRQQMEERIAELEEERQQKLAAAREIEDDELRAEEVAKYSEPIEREDYLNEERMTDIEQTFAAQKGALQWPVASGTISEHFGRRRHPVYGTVTENPGVEIVTDPQEQVHVVCDGYVVAVRPIPGYGDVVIVKHGKYFTAYGNLSRVMVRQRAVLQTGDVIGLSGDQNSEKGESLFFMVREGNTNLNPEAWLASNPS